MWVVTCRFLVEIEEEIDMINEMVPWCIIKTIFNCYHWQVRVTVNDRK